MTTLHYMKILPCYMEAKEAGDKPFEIRQNDDRGFQKGDLVKYIHTDGVREYEGVYEITYVTNYAQQDGFVVFGDRLLEDDD